MGNALISFRIRVLRGSIPKRGAEPSIDLSHLSPGGVYLQAESSCAKAQELFTLILNRKCFQQRFADTGRFGIVRGLARIESADRIHLGIR